MARPANREKIALCPAEKALESLVSRGRQARFAGPSATLAAANAGGREDRGENDVDNFFKHSILALWYDRTIPVAMMDGGYVA